MACEIHVGTCGFSYPEWVEAGIYPPGTKQGHTLPIYAETFNVVELNYTWYQIPRPDSLERMLEQVSPQFQFTAKLTRSLTHDLEPDDWKEKVAKYRKGISVLMDRRQLIAVLLQFGPRFDRTVSNRKYLGELLDELEGLPLAIEFRHRSWVHDRVFIELERRRVSLVTVDAPDLPGLFPTLNVVTNPALFYVRLHGRNASGWRTGNMQNKFNYDYSDDELAELLNSPVAELEPQAERGLIFFNNHVSGQAVRNAKMLMSMMGYK